ncbi:tetratricopeptide repeat protein [Pontixanthobacter sp.]|uniref:tetratricopeptide repeat protein n=1 Tax=Pontixanthobacter sp. TaxID=2792078 RepID=UPI003C7EC2C5
MNRLSRFVASATISAAMFAMSAPALANWRVAETDHFIYYSEAPEEELLKTVKEMETFDTLVRALTKNDKPASPVKVVMFEVATMDDVNKTFPYPSQGVGGYYSSTTSGPFLVTFRNTLRRGRGSVRKTEQRAYAWGPEVRQHEYLHHYMYQYFYTNYPSWYSEGFAEYYGTMAFPEEGVVEIGHAPFFRMDAIRGGSWVDAKDLLTAKSYADIDDVSALYAQGWLLTHLASQNPEIGNQLQNYLVKVAGGEDYLKAAEASFGDLNQLNKKLKSHRRNIKAMRLSLKPIDFGEIPIRELTDMESELMRYKIRLYSGFEYSDLAYILRGFDDITASDPNNVMGLEIRSQLENLAGKHSDALRSSDELLAINPGNVEALTQKGIASAALLSPSSATSDWDKAREPLNLAIESSSIAIAPRVAMFKTFLDQKITPSIKAQNALVEAFSLMPQNDEIRYLLAHDFEKRGLLDDAIAVIKPSAFGTFDGDEGEKRKRDKFRQEAADRFTHITAYEDAKVMLSRLEAKRDGSWDEASQSIITKDASDDQTSISFLSGQ